MNGDDVPGDKWYCIDKCKNESGKRKNQTGKSKTVNRLLGNKQNYAVRLIWRVFNQKMRRDYICENDGYIIIMHLKFDMLEFLEKHHPTYFLRGQRLLSAVSGVSLRLQKTLIWT